jgi:Flp pilus assembly protein TadG
MRDEVIVGSRGPARRGARLPTVTAVSKRPWRGDDGAVTAEAAVVVPLLVAVAMALVWLVALAATQVRVVDAARESARAAARGESNTAAAQRGRSVAPDGARIMISRGDGTVTVDVLAEVRGPGGLLTFLPAVPVTSRAVAAEEPAAGGGQR